MDGTTDAIAREWLARAGKRWRPYLATCCGLWVALESDGRRRRRAAGRRASKLAVAVECFHKASLIHDDIEDGDLARYGEPTLHAEHGVPVALNVGDLLLGRRLPPAGGELGLRRRACRAHAVAARGHVTLVPRPGRRAGCGPRAPRPLTVARGARDLPREDRPRLRGRPAPRRRARPARTRTCSMSWVLQRGPRHRLPDPGRPRRLPRPAIRTTWPTCGRR